MRFYLVRHAHADWSSDENRPLSAGGFQDAVRVAELLSARRIGAIISSPYLRARQTVDPLASRLDLETRLDARFRERTLGKWPAGSFDDAVRNTWRDFDFSYPAGETNRAAQRRATEALQELLTLRNHERYVIGTHGNLLALILNHYDATIGYDFWSELTMPDIYCLALDGAIGTRYDRVWRQAV